MKELTRREFLMSVSVVAGGTAATLLPERAFAQGGDSSQQSSPTASGVISLPKGGGALKGIGEKFTPDLFTGTGNYSVPIELPPGRNGFQPQLSLVYSTGNVNSPF